MKTFLKSLIVLFAIAPLAFAQTPSAAPKVPTATTTTASSPAAPATTTSSPATTTTTSAAPSAEEMKKMMEQMMELGKPGENHKLLAEMAGSWTYTMKMMMDPTTGKPSESKGTATRKAIFDGRYFTFDVSGKFQMPGKDGKPMDMNFKGMAIEGYDNVTKKFFSSWIDNMSTLMMNAEGTYDAATKTFTYMANCEMMPGMKTKMREVIKVVDKDHHTFEMYEDRGTGETKSMEIAYTRSGKK
ncbi:MAG: hypothetical protein V7609_2935 [Verrucomicrobiota bacterium]